MTRICQSDPAAAVALEQPQAELILRSLDLSAERRLADVQTVGRSSEGEFLCHGDEVAQMTQIHSGKLHCYLEGHQSSTHQAIPLATESIYQFSFQR